MSENQTEAMSPQDRPISRRRLVKSALVLAPVVLTLRSGAALANASAYQCIQRDQSRADAGANPLRTSDEPKDDWARQEVIMKKIRARDDSGNSVGDPFWVYQDPQSGNWHTEDGSPVLSDYNEVDSGTGHIQILFDDMGQITGYGKVGTTGGPITGSCWASFG